MENYKHVNYTAQNPHYGLDEALGDKLLAEMPFIDLVTDEGEIFAHLYLHRFNKLRVSKKGSDILYTPILDYIDMRFSVNEELILTHGDYDSALYLMKLLVEIAIYETSHKSYLSSSRCDLSCTKIYAPTLQDREALDNFARMCVDAYRTHMDCKADWYDELD